MPTEYRRVRPTEETAVLDLFLAAYTQYPDEGIHNFSGWQDVPDRFYHTYGAITPDQHIVATAVYWPRAVRDELGKEQFVGHLSHVVTRPDVRRQGYASNLIAETLAAMQQNGCTWSSLLTASPEGRSLYDRLGWRAMPTFLWRGTLTGASPQIDAPYNVQRYDPRRRRRGWSPLTAVYVAYNATRPLAVARDQHYWHDYIATQCEDGLAANRLYIFTATRLSTARTVCAYIFLHLYEDSFLISEGAAYPGDESALILLLARSTALALEAGAGEGEIFLPDDAKITPILEQLMGPTLQRITTDVAMARPIEPTMDMERLEKLFTAPGAMWWRLDML